MTGSGRSKLSERARRARTPLVVASVVAALGLCVSLALSASAQTAPAGSPLVLEQLVDGEVRCVSTATETCDVDLYGRDGRHDGVSIEVDRQRTTSVQLRNASRIDASALDVYAGACHTETRRTGEPVPADLCSKVTVAVACTTPGVTPFAWGPGSLSSFGQDTPHLVSSGLPAGATTTCDVTVAIPPETPPVALALQAVQPITWTLSAPESAVAPETLPGPGEVAVAGAVLPVTGRALVPAALAGVTLVVAGALLRRWSRTVRTVGTVRSAVRRRR